MTTRYASADGLRDRLLAATPLGAALLDSPVLRRFRLHQAATSCPFASGAVLCGGYDADPSLSAEENCLADVPLLDAFTRISRALHLDGFVTELATEHARDVAGLARATNVVLRRLSASDPTGNRCLEEDVTNPRWRFRFNGQEMFVSASASFYPPSHSRHSGHPDSAFLFFQPMHAFDPTGPLHTPQNDALKRRIRTLFARHGHPYDVALVTQPLEATRYVKPLRIGDPPVRWWET